MALILRLALAALALVLPATAMAGYRIAAEPTWVQAAPSAET